MKISSVNRFKVNYHIEKSGMKKGEIAETIGLKNWQLSNRIAGRILWKFEELSKLAILLRFDISEVISL